MLFNLLSYIDFLLILSLVGLISNYNSMFKQLILLECATLAIIIKASLCSVLVFNMVGQVMGLVFLVLAAIESVLGLSLMFNLFVTCNTTTIFESYSGRS